MMTEMAPLWAVAALGRYDDRDGSLWAVAALGRYDDRDGSPLGCGGISTL